MSIKFQAPYTAQGDLNIFSCEEFPEGIREKKPKNGKHILAHSETGHHHVINGDTARVFEQDEFVSFMEVIKESNIVHLRPFDTHKAITLPHGKYRLTRQREYIPEGFRIAAD